MKKIPWLIFVLLCVIANVANAYGDLPQPSDLISSIKTVFTFRTRADQILLINQSTGQNLINLILRILIQDEKLYILTYIWYPSVFLFFSFLVYARAKNISIFVGIVLITCNPVIGEVIGGSQQTTLMCCACVLLCMRMLDDFILNGKFNLTFTLAITLFAIGISNQFYIYILFFILPYWIIKVGNFHHFVNQLRQPSLLDFLLSSLLFLNFLSLVFNFGGIGKTSTIESFIADIRYSYGINSFSLIYGNLTATNINTLVNLFIFFISIILWFSNRLNISQRYYLIYLYVIFISLKYFPFLVSFVPMIGFIRNPTKLNIIILAFTLAVYVKNDINPVLKKLLTVAMFSCGVLVLFQFKDFPTNLIEQEQSVHLSLAEGIAEYGCTSISYRDNNSLDVIRPLGSFGTWYFTQEQADHDKFRSTNQEPDYFYKRGKNLAGETLCIFLPGNVIITRPTVSSTPDPIMLFSSGLFLSAKSYSGDTTFHSVLVDSQILQFIIDIGVLGFSSRYNAQNAELTYLHYSLSVIINYFKMLVFFSVVLGLAIVGTKRLFLLVFKSTRA